MLAGKEKDHIMVLSGSTRAKRFLIIYLHQAENSAILLPLLKSFRDERRSAFQVGRRVLTCGDEMRVEFIVELEDGCWLEDGEGDPPRTLDVRHARRFSTIKKAETELRRARAYRPFNHANIYRYCAKKVVSC